jgi:hypothetical protein
VLKKAILFAYKKGVKIRYIITIILSCRMITDDECSKFNGADIYDLAA